MAVNETTLPTTVDNLRDTMGYLATKRNECRALLDTFEGLLKVPAAPPATGTVNPTDPGTGSAMTTARRNTVYDACIADANAMIALRPTPSGGDSDGGGGGGGGGPSGQ